MKKKLKSVSKNTINIVLISLLTLLLFTANFEVAVIIALLWLIIFNIYNLILFVFKKIFKKELNIYIQAIILGAIVSIMEFILNNNFNQIYLEINLYFPLVIATCLIMKKNVITYNSKKRSFLQCLYLEVSFVSLFVITAGIREVLATNMITLMSLTSLITGYEMSYKIFPFDLEIPLFAEPLGAFIILAIVAAIIQLLKGGINNESN